MKYKSLDEFPDCVAAMAHGERGQYDHMLAYALQFAAMEPARPQGDFLVGLAYDALGQEKAAEAYMLRSLEKVRAYSVPLEFELVHSDARSDVDNADDLGIETDKVVRGALSVLTRIYRSAGRETELDDLYGQMHHSLRGSIAGLGYQLVYADYLRDRCRYAAATKEYEGYLEDMTIGNGQPSQHVLRNALLCHLRRAAELKAALSDSESQESGAQ